MMIRKVRNTETQRTQRARGILSVNSVPLCFPKPATRDALLPKLLSGEIRVADADNVAETWA